MSPEEIEKAVINYAMQQYTGYRLMGEAPAFALREATKRLSRLMEDATQKAERAMLRENYRDVEDGSESYRTD